MSDNPAATSNVYVAMGEPDDPAQPTDGVALCLSGGGYRAMLFQICVRWRLNELH